MPGLDGNPPDFDAIESGDMSAITSLMFVMYYTLVSMKAASEVQAATNTEPDAADPADNFYRLMGIFF